MSMIRAGGITGAVHHAIKQKVRPAAQRQLLAKRHDGRHTGTVFSATLADRFDPRANNFDAVRLIAAVMVLVSHAYSLTGHAFTPTGAEWDPIEAALGLGYGGAVAVDMFFVISGFLIARSFERRTIPQYLTSRVLRIIPALVLVTTIEAWIIAPAFFEGNVRWYLLNLAPAHMRNVLIFGEDPWIAGVFTRHKYSFMNGSLWTLPVETLFYLLLPFVLMLSRGRRWAVLAMWLLAIAAGLCATAMGMSDDNRGAMLFRSVQAFPAIQMSAFFLAGVVAWLYRDRIPFDAGVFALCALLLFAAADSAARPVVMTVCLPYCVLYLGLSGNLGTRLKRAIGDLSYGVYLFSYPLLNVTIALFGLQISAEQAIIVALPVTLMVAAVSWWLVERPALQFKLRRATEASV